MPLTEIERDIQEAVQDYFDATDAESAQMARVVSEFMAAQNIPINADNGRKLLEFADSLLTAWGAS